MIPIIANFSARLREAQAHLRNGTIVSRVRSMIGWRLEYISRRARGLIRKGRTAWWRRRVARSRAMNKRVQRGLRIRLHADSHLSHEIYQGDFEWQERRFLNAFLCPGDIFVDVGANVGFFTLIAAKRVGPSGHVHAFEPCTKTHRRLVSNVKLNKLHNVSCHQLALSDDDADVPFNISLQEFDAHNSLAPLTQGELSTTEIVRAVTWDSFARDKGLIGEVTLMKIDVEGWEGHVLAGASDVLSREDAPVLLVEFTDENAQAAGTSCQELYRSLEHLGYRMFVYDPKSKVLISDPLREEYPYINLIAAKHLDRITSRLG